VNKESEFLLFKLSPCSECCIIFFDKSLASDIICSPFEILCLFNRHERCKEKEGTGRVL
jgi:hypothetical protein